MSSAQLSMSIARIRTPAPSPRARTIRPRRRAPTTSRRR
jgi:hypothetical protein